MIEGYYGTTYSYGVSGFSRTLGTLRAMHIAATPVSESDRLQALDVLRGFAVLGILVMNIQMFSMPFAAYFNPYGLGEPALRDLAIWSINHVLADQKFMTIFSLLFGAGVLLLTTRVAAREASPARIHYRRMFWLLVFGLMHAYVLWHGDILFREASSCLWAGLVCG